VEARGGEPKINLPIRLPTFAEGFRPDPGGIGLLIDPIPELWDRISIVFAGKGGLKRPGIPDPSEIGLAQLQRKCCRSCPAHSAG
jgi:hypothetical protein